MEHMKPEYKLEQYCLFLLDFLGQSEKLRQLSSNSEKESEIEKMLSGILFLKETTQIKGITTRQQFSDTVLIYFKTADLKRDEMQNRLKIITGRIGNIFLQCLAYKMPFRGVGVIGDGFELEPNNFYGPVLLEANKQEKSIPSYPRIVLSKEIVSILGKKHENLFLDDDGIYCINPLTIAIRDGMPRRKTTFDNCLSFIRDEKATESLSILSKYTRLENMFIRLGISWQGCEND